jgi:hypothetical protein
VDRLARHAACTERFNDAVAFIIGEKGERRAGRIRFGRPRQQGLGCLRGCRLVAYGCQFHGNRRALLKRLQDLARKLRCP